MHTGRSLPSVSIIIVNYNGRHLLPDCLSSLEKLKYSGDYEIIVVDNNSNDDSCSFIRKHHPKVKIVQLSKNEGFARGNNIGFSHASGEYIAFLNSDTKADELWLQELVKTMRTNEKIGLISSQLIYFTPYIDLEIHSDILFDHNSSERAPLGVMLENITVPDDGLQSKVWYNDGFYEQEDGPIPTRYTKDIAQALLPMPLDSKKALKYKFTFHGHQEHEETETHFKIYIAGKLYIEETISSHEVKQIEITVDQKSVPKDKYCWLVQNAGNCVMSDGYSRDRGSILRQGNNDVEEFYEKRSSYFDNPALLLAVCGGSFMTRRELIEGYGLFDDDYFMYYEDLDLSLRYWKAGWDIAYCPTSIAYHKHRATTGKSESVFFLYHLEKNHLLFVLTHFPFSVILQELFSFVLRVCATELRVFIFQFKNNLPRLETWRKKQRARRNAVWAFISLFIVTLKKRHTFSAQLQRSSQDLKTMIY